MFGMSDAVHFRTLPSPQDAQEEGILRALDELADALSEAEHEPADRLVDALVDARDTARVIRRSWDVLPPMSPYREVLADAAHALARLADLGWGAAPTVAGALEDERADFLLMDARLPLMRAVRTALDRMSVRELARTTGLSAGHVSELSNARGGLPNERTARALEAVTGPGLAEIVARAKAEARSIRDLARGRERKLTRKTAVAPGSTDALMRVNLALTDDAELLALVQRVIALRDEGRRALATLLSVQR
jgi:transcriptional regulator with XRE-family HTH domain